jgi:hypothetical protein
LGTETTGQLSLTDAELDRVTAGTLVIGRSDVASSAITVSSALTLDANTTLNAGSGNILLPGTVSNFGAGAFSLTPITSGAGLTTISGANTNTTTVVTTGVVQINNTTASTTNFAVSGGTLKGTGSIGNLTGTGAGIIAPGNSPGLVTTTNLSLTSTNTLQIEINNVSPPVAGTDYDQIVVSSGGTVALVVQLCLFQPPLREAQARFSPLLITKAPVLFLAFSAAWLRGQSSQPMARIIKFPMSAAQATMLL